MRITWISVILSACLGMTDASPIPTTVSQSRGSESRTGSPLLVALKLTDDQVSLVPEKPLKSDESLRASTSSHSALPETERTFSFTENKVPFYETSEKTDSPHSRGVRSITSDETQVPLETTVVHATKEITAGSVKEEETTASPIKELTTAGYVKEETTAGLVMENTTTGLTEVVLDQEILENASETVVTVLGKIEYQIWLLNVTTNYPADELSRPMLPSNIIEHAKQCVEVQWSLRAMHEVLSDFISHLEGLKTLNGDTTVQRAVWSLNFKISKLISPTYIYSATAAPGTNVKSSEAVMCTLITLKRQCFVIQQVLSDLQNC